METITKTIKTITEKPGTSKAGKPYVRFDFEFTDGFKLGTFDDKIGTAFKPGQIVDIDTEQNGQYLEMKAMRVSEAKEVTPQAPINSIRDNLIIAQTLTKAYCSAAPTDISKEDVFEAYQYFLKELSK